MQRAEIAKRAIYGAMFTQEYFWAHLLFWKLGVLSLVNLFIVSHLRARRAKESVDTF